MKAGLKGLIDQGRPNDFSDQLVKVGNTLERVSNGFGVSIGERSEQPLAKDSVALDLENGGGARVDSLAQIQDALEEEGIVFVPADAAGGPGVRIAKRNS
jgi:hypothetical protein